MLAAAFCEIVLCLTLKATCSPLPPPNSMVISESPVAISEEEARAGPGPVLREASGVHAAPLRRIPSPSAIHEVPAAMQGRP